MTIFLGILTVLSLYHIDRAIDWKKTALGSLLTLGLATLTFLSWMASAGML